MITANTIKNISRNIALNRQIAILTSSCVPTPTNQTTSQGFHSVASGANKTSSSLVSQLKDREEQIASIGAPRAFTSLNEDTPYQLCFLRHGQSTWNRDNRFIGWTDTPLTDDGVLEARVAGQMLYRSGIRFDEVHTSMLRRSIRTANLALMELGQEYIPVHKHWRLNERNYGSLVGQNKKEVVQEFGKDQVKRWRRSYNEPPPAMHDDHPYHPARDPRYRMMLDKIPRNESLKDTLDRSTVYWEEVIKPALQAGKTLLITGHENNLRSLLMHLEGISPDDIIDLSIPRAVPLAYRLDLETVKPLDRPDGKFDEATGFLRGEWIGGDKAVSQILERDHKQVYDTSVTTNLETDCKDRRKWTTYMDTVLGEPSPEAKAKSANVPHHDSLDNDENRMFFSNTACVPGVEMDKKEPNGHGSISVPPPFPSTSHHIVKAA
eukprot:CAMPEP_0172446714 /NCGR_PEP_ID=MMETSP1065-20121228/6257_1 /TAXON_ID=265537 /ORGANISM="Amphiprora paludosa, Strain CCMP125" /LENGTH=435 /DNA_ID=CAMNT_0013197903 /DNA_START=726 /DNA_END=2033 /DNA_ORIENTATION=+